MSKKICIVGGAGFIGHNLAVKLKDFGHKVTIIDSLAVNNFHSLQNDNLPNPHLSKSILDERIFLLKKNDINLIINDARDYHLISKTITNLSPDTLIHLSAVSHANNCCSDKDNKSPLVKKDTPSISPVVLKVQQLPQSA